MVNGTNLTPKPVAGSGVGGGGMIMGAETVSTMSLWGLLEVTGGPELMNLRRGCGNLP